MTFGSPETAGAGGGATVPGRQLDAAIPGSSPASGTLFGPRDVSSFTQIVIAARISSNNAGDVVFFQPSFTDAAGNVFVSNFTLPQMMLSHANMSPTSISLVCAYRVLAPMCSVLITNNVGAQIVASWWGLNTPPRFDGPYTPDISGAVIGQNDSLASGATQSLTPTAGPAFFGINLGAAGQNLVIEYQDPTLLSTWHQLAILGNSTATGDIIRSVPIWLPPVPCRARSSTGANGFLVMAT